MSDTMLYKEYFILGGIVGYDLVDGLEDGYWRLHNCQVLTDTIKQESKVLVEGRIENGLREGEFLYRQYSDLEIKTYLHGKLHGINEVYDGHGQLIFFGMYDNGKKTGTFMDKRSWNPQIGWCTMITIYKADSVVSWLELDSNDFPILQGYSYDTNYNHHGRVTGYHADRKLAFVADFDRGKLVYYELYDEKGILRETGEGVMISTYPETPIESGKIKLFQGKISVFNEEGKLIRTIVPEGD